MRTSATICATISLLLLAACGGGGSATGINISPEGAPWPTITPNSISISDLIVSGDGEIVRVSDVFCRPSGSCRATVRGETIQFQAGEGAEDDPRISVDIYTTLGEWNNMRPGALYGLIDGIQVRYAGLDGIVYPNSLPHQGSATWRGDMVGLDANNRVIRGEAMLTIEDLGSPEVDVLLTPQSRPDMAWNNLDVRNGGFSQKRTASDYIKGEFYGRQAEEAGGVFERNGIIGAFGASTN